MKLRTTNKQLKEWYSKDNTITIGYCNAQHLLEGLEPFAYTCGVYGWNSDNYEITHNNIRYLISSGYRPIDGNIRNYDITRKYDEKARAIRNNYNLDYKTQLRKIEKLRNKWLDEIIL